MNEEIEERLYDAQDELKRVDHIIYVSLKYTRTVDIIRNALLRVISTFDNIIAALLLYKGEEKLPKSPRLQVNKLRELYTDDEKINYYLDFYVFLRDLIKAKYDRKEEFRRGVTMITHLDRRTAFINIDNLEDNIDAIAKGFFSYARQIILNEEE